MHLLTALVVLLSATPAQGPLRPLEIYFVDVEGGAATLIVTPSLETILIDTGSAGDRDAERIARVVRGPAGRAHIDHVIATHWHLDHFGGHADLAKRIPLRNFYDRGEPEQPDDPVNYPALIAAYRKVTGGKSTVMKPGDRLPLRQAEGTARLEMLCVVGSGKTVPDRPGAPRNPHAENHVQRPPDPSDNAQSLGFRLRFGDFVFLNLGDITWNVEYDLIAPTDKIGPVDLFQVTHHGLDLSNNPALLQTIRPTAAVISNGPRKGAHPAVVAALRAAGTKAVYQLHRNLGAGDTEQTDRARIANLLAECNGEYVVARVAPDGRSFTLQIGANGTPERFEVRKK